MPKCLNDATKTYTGKEENPKGLGFSASGEKVGTVMKGKDGKDYKVHETKTCLKWVLVEPEKTPKTKSNKPKEETPSIMDEEPEMKSEYGYDSEFIYSDAFLKEKEYKGYLNLFERIKKFNPSYLELHENNFAKFFFENLMNLSNVEEMKHFFYEEVFIPIVSKKPLETETGLEEKFGGEKPFFIEGENWPTYTDSYGDTLPYDFVCQYYDPKIKDKKMLVRVFLPLSDEETFLNGSVPTYYDNLEIDSNTLKKQITIERPNAEQNKKYVDHSFKPLEPYLITKFNQTIEIKELNYILSYLKFPTSKENRELNMYIQGEYDELRSIPVPNRKIKIGGTRVHCQYIDGYEPENILQLTEEPFFEYSFGDCGFGHLSKTTSEDGSEKYHFSWDCY